MRHAPLRKELTQRLLTYRAEAVPELRAGRRPEGFEPPSVWGEPFSGMGEEPGED